MHTSEADLLNHAMQNFQQGRDEAALNNIRAILNTNPGNCEANNLAARIFLKQGNLEYAQQAIDMAHECKGESKETQVLAIDLLVEQHKLFEAYEAGNAYLKKNRSDNEFRYKLAVIATRVGRVQDAIQLLQEYIRKKGTDPFAWLNLGHMYKAQSKMDSAAEVYRQFIDKKPEMDGVGYWHMADIKDASFSQKDLSKLNKSVSKGGNDAYNLSLLHFALGTHHDKNKDPDQAFQSFRKANDLHRSLKPFNHKAYAKFIASLENISRTEKFEFPAAPVPIFILGMPRSGSTLCERILSGHSDVVATDELSFINFMAAGLERTGSYAKAISSLTKEQALAMRQSYLSDTKNYRKGEHKFFIDKNPTNFLHIPLIKTLFPEALIVHTYRDLMDNALSIYKRYFFFGHEYGYSFEDLDKYYQGYVRIMAHWDNLYPGEIFHLNYEKMVADAQGQITALLDYCQLAHEQSCFEFHKNKSAVLTPSVDQVSKPIYNKAVGAWKPYEKFIGQYAKRFELYFEHLTKLGAESKNLTDSVRDASSDDALVNNDAEIRDAWSDYWTQGHITSFGEKFANNYQGSIRKYWRALFSDLKEGSNILDVATGNGALLEIAKEEIPHPNVELTGVDYAKIPDRIISQRVGIRMLSETSVEALPFEVGTIDIVISQYGVEYADFPKAISEISRVLAEEGIVRFICHCEQSVVLQDNRMIHQCSHELLMTGGACDNLRALLVELDKNNQSGVMDTEQTEKCRATLNNSLATVHDKYGEALFGTGFVDKMKTILAASVQFNKQDLFAEYLQELTLSQRRLEDLFSAGFSKTEQDSLEQIFVDAGLTLTKIEEIVEAGFGVIGLAIEAKKKK